jgi:hypothetical protein
MATYTFIFERKPVGLSNKPSIIRVNIGAKSLDEAKQNFEKHYNNNKSFEIEIIKIEGPKR